MQWISWLSLVDMVRNPRAGLRPVPRCYTYIQQQHGLCKRGESRWGRLDAPPLPGKPMAIWTGPVDLDQLNAYQQDTLVSRLGIRYTGIGEDWLAASMPV